MFWWRWFVGRVKSEEGCGGGLFFLGEAMSGESSVSSSRVASRLRADARAARRARARALEDVSERFEKIELRLDEERKRFEAAVAKAQARLDEKSAAVDSDRAELVREALALEGVGRSEVADWLAISTNELARLEKFGEPVAVSREGEDAEGDENERDASEQSEASEATVSESVAGEASEDEASSGQW